jgi:hypothetical protein
LAQKQRYAAVDRGRHESRPRQRSASTRSENAGAVCRRLG